MLSPYPVYLWRVSIVYKGYLIVPVQGRVEHGITGYNFAVFDPFGEQLHCMDGFNLVDEFEDFWQEGKPMIDKDIVTLNESPTPTQTAIFRDIGAIA